MSQGDCREKIFLDDVDRQDFLKTWMWRSNRNEQGQVTMNQHMHKQRTKVWIDPQVTFSR
jgi:hypothetical protein